MKHVALAGLALLIYLCAVTPAAAQGYVQVEGWVQWISGQRLQLVLDNGLSISVDLTHVPQGDYQALGPGAKDRVAVVGVIAPDNRRLIASSVTRVRDWGDYPFGSPQLMGREPQAP
ncbi:MAG TPA: hypothetical protein VMS64_21335 [Candidatus Methylomirabilis sp.]|nr:hypothetical protein [Candidatus Methylomirabilis sp.]